MRLSTLCGLHRDTEHSGYYWRFETASWRISYFFSTILGCEAEAWGEMFYEKTGVQKSCETVPSKIIATIVFLRFLPIE
jgi:hypothetical protein